MLNNDFLSQSNSPSNEYSFWQPFGQIWIIDNPRLLLIK